MASYTRIKQSDLVEILSAYSLGEPLSIHELKGGQANSSFRFATRQGDFVLSVCDEKPLPEVIRLVAVLDLLKTHDFPTTRVVKTRNGEPALDWHGKPVMIKSYIAGDVPREINGAMMRQVGRQLARLHRIPAPAGIPRRFAYGLDSFREVIDAHRHSGYGRWLAAKSRSLEEALACDLPRCMIHGDLFYDNTLFDDGQLVAVLDFEEVCVYFRIFDIGMCLVGFWAREGKVSLELAGSLLSGYQSEMPLTAEERARLRDFAVFGATATSFWRFRQYNMVIPGSPLARSHLPMDRLADELTAFPREAFRDAVFNN